MLAVVCYVLAGLLFLLAGFNQELFKQGTVDEIAFGLFFVVLAWVFGGIGPPAPWVRRQ